MPLNGTLPLWEITDIGLYEGKPSINRYWYRQQANVFVTAAVVAAAFVSKFSTARRAIANPNWSSVTIRADMVNDISNFTEISSYGAGTYTTGTTQDVANFIAAAVRLFRTTRETRSGWKRYGGLSEGMISARNLESAALALLSTLAALCDDVMVAGGENFDPVIVRKLKDPVTGEFLPPSDWVYNPISSAVAQSAITTQNSRKLYT